MNNEIILWKDQEITVTPEGILGFFGIFPNETTRQDAMNLIAFCRCANLNPFVGEVHFFQDKGHYKAIVAKDVYHKRAELHPQYDGMEYSEGPSGPNGLPEWAEVKIYRKDRKHPTVKRVWMAEYYKATPSGKGSWERMPRTMLEKVCKMQALKETFPNDMGGFISQEEVDSNAWEPEAPRRIAAEIETAAAPAEPVGDIWETEASPEAMTAFELDIVAKIARIMGEKARGKEDLIQERVRANPEATYAAAWAKYGPDYARRRIKAKQGDTGVSEEMYRRILAGHDIAHSYEAKSFEEVESICEEISMMMGMEG